MFRASMLQLPAVWQRGDVPTGFTCFLLLHPRLGFVSEKKESLLYNRIFTQSAPKCSEGDGSSSQAFGKFFSYLFCTTTQSAECSSMTAQGLLVSILSHNLVEAEAGLRG